MKIDTSEPLYLALPHPQWDRTQRAGDISGHVEFTNSMRLASKDASALARSYPGNNAYVLKIDTERLLRDYGDPMSYVQTPGRHFSHEFSISFLLHRIEQFVKYVIAIIAIDAATIIGDGPDHAY